MGQKSWQATQFIVRVFNPPGSTVVFQFQCFFLWMQLCKSTLWFWKSSEFSSRVSQPCRLGIFLLIYPLHLWTCWRQLEYFFGYPSVLGPLLLTCSLHPLPQRLIWVIKPFVMYTTLRQQFVVAHLPPQATLRDFNVCHIVFLQEKPCPWPPQTKSCWDSVQKAAHLPKVSILFTKVSTHSNLSQ